jgi:dihydroxyacid dehydratase/phosphogluconate dehydratase
VLDADGVYRKVGPARVFTSERGRHRCGEGLSAAHPPGDVIVLAGCGRWAAGMEETYQLPRRCAICPWGKEVALITDARFQRREHGRVHWACGTGGARRRAAGRVRDGDALQIMIDP